MLSEKLKLISEQTSPLFRIMWAFNPAEPGRRSLDYNVSAFHIGNGLILTVGHVLRADTGIIRTFEEADYQANIVPHLGAPELPVFDRSYPLDSANNRRYVNIATPEDAEVVAKTIRKANYDTRLLTLMQGNLVKPYVIVQFSTDVFYGQPPMARHFDASTHFHEVQLNRHTFMLEVENIENFWTEDISVFRIVNKDPELIALIPSIEIEFRILEDNQDQLYCLQSSPSGSNLGRLINSAIIEGYLDHHGPAANDPIATYLFEGTRYLIKGYFRFGSSGAPYVVYDAEAGHFKVNAVQSEASPIQLTIANNRDGNFQYVNAIASPLSIIQERLERLLGR